MEKDPQRTTISLMLAVPDTPAAVEWYARALGARLLWSLGSVAGLEVEGAPFFLHEPVKPGFQSPSQLAATTTRIELFVEQPEEVIARAVAAGARGHPVVEHAVPWGMHRQGNFVDPYGHHWSVGDRTPLNRFPA